jgi:addiction module HigA family antidote
MNIRIEDIHEIDFRDVAEPRAKAVVPTHPGEILLNEFLVPLHITQYRLAKSIGVAQRRIGEIVAGKRAITADSGLRLSRFFGMSDTFWISLQSHYDAAVARKTLATELSQIVPWENQNAA